MLRILSQTLFTTRPYPDLLERNHARMIYGMTTMIVIIYTLYLFLVPTSRPGGITYFETALQRPHVMVFQIIFYVLAGVIFVLLWSGRRKLAAWGPMLMWASGVGVATLETGYTSASHGLNLAGIVLLGGLLGGPTVLAAATALALSLTALAMLLRPILPAEGLLSYVIGPEALAEAARADFITTSLELLGIAGLVYLFTVFSRLVEERGAVEAVQERETGAAVISQIAEKVAERGSLNDLLNTIVDRVRDNFSDVYHAQVFLVNEEASFAQLVASTGAVGRMLLADSHAIAVGSQSVIGQVTLNDQPVVALANAPGTIHRYNPRLPDTAVEAAFPLRVGDRLIGALDVQSKERDAFREANLVATFQALADSTALAIDNVRQHEAAQRRLRENEALVAQTRETMREVERLNEHLTGRAWQDYIRSQPELFAREVTFEAGVSSTDDIDNVTWTDTLREAVASAGRVRAARDDAQVIAVPLRVRGQVVGAMEFELPADRELSADDEALIDEIAERFGLAAENARLIENSQRVAQREAIVNKVSGRFQATNDVLRTLEEAAQGLQEELHTRRVAIRLGTPTQPTATTPGPLKKTES